jgi:hypothetical protein
LLSGGSRVWVVPRVRRPLIALIALLAALAIGYGIKAAHSDSHPPTHPHAAPSTSNSSK